MFKNLIFYEVKEPLNLEDIETKLESFKSKEPSRTAIETIGFNVAYPSASTFVHSVGNSHYFSIRKFKKNVPPKLVNYRLNQKIIKASENNQLIDKKMRLQFKEEIINDIASNTPAIPENITFMYDETAMVIVADCSSATKAEACLALLRKAIGSVPVIPLIKLNIAGRMTSWCFDNELPEELEILEKGKLRASDETKSEASFNRQFMDADEVIAARESGKEVISMHFMFENDFTFILTDEGFTKSIKYTDFKIEQLGEAPKNDEAILYDTQAAINTETVRKYCEFLKREFT